MNSTMVQMIGLVFIDPRKAFQELEHYGVYNRNLSWIQSYLCNREQFCRVNGINSETKKQVLGCHTRLMSWASPYSSLNILYSVSYFQNWSRNIQNFGQNNYLLSVSAACLIKNWLIARDEGASLIVVILLKLVTIHRR